MGALCIEVRSRSPRRAAVGPWVAIALACVLLPACGTGRRAGASTGEATSRSGAAGATLASAPAWVGEPLSWEVLDRVERWLDENPRATAHWRNEAWLVLAEGRLAFGAETSGSGKGSQSQSRARLSRAYSDFQRVLNDPSASAEQRRRAERGAEIARNGAGPTAPAPRANGNVVTRAQWGASPPRTTELTRHRGAYSWITIHHSAMDGGDGSLASSIDAVRRIQRDHVTNRGYGDVGYHYFIDPAGRVFEGRSLEWQGAHSGSDDGGRNTNPKNIGVCLLGDFEVDQPTPAAIATLDRVIAEIREHYKLPPGAIKPHRYWKDTLCPGRNMNAWLARQV